MEEISYGEKFAGNQGPTLHNGKVGDEHKEETIQEKRSHGLPNLMSYSGIGNCRMLRTRSQ